jgi:uncharacterized membrane protein
LKESEASLVEWFWLGVSAVICIGASFLSFNESWRDKSWFLLVSIGLATTSATIWYSMVRYIGDIDRLYFYSACWDSVIFLVYYLIPVLFFGIRLESSGLVGIVLIGFGLALLRLN